MAVGSTRVVQITNIAPQATKDQMQTLFGYLGKIDDIRLYPTIRDVSCPVQSRICYVKFMDPATVGVAQHMTNTVFIDRALIVIPIQNGEIPDEHKALEMSSNGTIVPGLYPSEPKLPPNIINTIEGVAPNQFVQTRDPQLDALGLPQYPPLPASYDLCKIEEIRRTMLVVNVDNSISTQKIIDFFSNAGEVKYTRTCTRDSDKSHCVLIEFTDQSSIIPALQMNGRELDGKPLTLYHSTQAIVKPQAKSNEAAQREIEEAMSRVKEAQNLISAAIDPVIGMLSKDKRSSRRSRSRSRGRRRSRSRSRRRSHSRHRSRRSRTRSRDRRHRSRSKKRSRSRSRSTKSSRRSRTRSKSRSKYSRSKNDRDKRSKDRESKDKSKDEKESSEKDKNNIKETNIRDYSVGREDSVAKERAEINEHDEKDKYDSKDHRKKYKDKYTDKDTEKEYSRESKSRDKDISRLKEKDKKKDKPESDVDDKKAKDRKRSASRSRSRYRSRSREYERRRSRSKHRKRSKSRDRKRSRSKSRKKRSQSKDRKKSRSRDRKRSRSKDRRRSQSHSRRRKGTLSPSPLIKRRSRSRSAEKNSRTRNKNKDKERYVDKKDFSDKESSDSGSKVPRNYDEEEKGFDEKKSPLPESESSHGSRRESTEKSDNNMDISNSP